MCGRYAQSIEMRELIEQFQVTGSTPPQSLPQNWNIAPTNSIYVIRADSDDPSKRNLATLSWGLIGHWLHELSDARASQSRAINARSESIHEKPTFRSSFRNSRCLIPADGYYEWATALGKYSPKQPFYISSTKENSLSIAGVWSSWRSPNGEIIESAAIITREAVGELATIHSRMPVMMPEDSWKPWLDPREKDVDHLKTLMVNELPDAGLKIRPVSNLVNSVVKNGRDLTDEIALGEPTTLF